MDKSKIVTKYYLIGRFIFCLIIFSCTNERIDTNALAKELKSRKIVHLTQGEISEKAFLAGKTLMDTIANLLENCKQNSKINCCDVDKYDVITNFCKDFDADVKFVPLKDSSNLSDIEKDILRAYVYLYKNNLPMESNIQNLRNGYWLYSQPVLTNNKFSCEQSKITDFLGIWNIKMSQKMIILNIENN